MTESNGSHKKGMWKILFKGKRKKNKASANIKSFVDMIAPSIIKFYPDYYICGNTYRSVWALREYPTTTEEQALLKHLGEKDGVTLKIYARHVTATEERKIISNAANKNRMKRGSTNDLQETVVAEGNLEDVTNLVTSMHRNREPLIHTAVYVELTATEIDKLKELQTEALTELIRSKINIDKLMLRQQQGFVSVMPSGYNAFYDQFERVLPASSVANLYPFNYSGKTDANGFYLGRAKYGSNVIIDFNKRADDRTNSNVLILGNSGQGKSYLLKLILINMLEAGKNVICLDPESEYEELCKNLGGYYVDLMSGEYMINPLEPKLWSDSEEKYEDDADVATFNKKTKLSQHISFLRDFFASYKDFTDSHIDTLEIMLEKLYESFGVDDTTDLSNLNPTDYPKMSDLYYFVEKEFREYDKDKKNVYTENLLQEILLGIHSMCVGSESKFFDGHTNVKSDRFVVFGVKGLLEASKNIKNALLFNVLSYMSNQLLTNGNTTAAIDELYLFLTNITAVEYIRNFSKRVRKKESAVVLASQNIEDFALQGIAEYTKPLFSIPTHSFLFNAGNIDAKFYMDTLQITDSEYELIRYPQRGVCLYKCGNDRYHLMVTAPKYKEKLFGKAGGR